LIHAILVELGVGLSKEAAEALYVAVSTDTGCFKYANTTSNTHRVAAAAMDAGIDARALNRKLFSIKSRARIVWSAPF
jgi:phosphoesterase RecJ-like protein